MTADVIRIFIGYDAKEAIAYHVLVHSLVSRSSRPLQVTPIALANLKNEMWRERNPLQSTDFSFSRFLTPYLSNYQGWSLFMDCDILALDDVAKLWDIRDDRWSVMCVKHDHQPKGETKFLGTVQTKYEKKNWSSVMLFNNAKCKALTPEYVNTATGLDLHRFKWLASDELIGEIPPRWNHLVGYSKAGPDGISMLHYTEGGPYFDDYKNSEFADLWFQERDRMLTVGKA
ncbi:MAG TPA: glycosyltransferase [Xanthobacteraceae bacterium]|nr:glycosyltransferase [Xanthobacteraceae bacterium]